MKCLLFFLAILSLTACAVSKPYNAAKKFAPAALQQDYDLFRAALEEAHPGLYWYTPRDSMQLFFNNGRAQLTDSLTEGQFRKILSYVVANIRCGHTAVRASAAAAGAPQPAVTFPLYIKAWPDTVMVTANLNRKDSVVTRGVILKTIDGLPMNRIIDSLFRYLPADGYNLTHKYQTLSNGGNFRALYASVFGLKAKTKIELVDTAGRLRTAEVLLYNAKADTVKRPSTPPKKLPRKEKKYLELLAARNLRIDSVLQTAFMEVNTFGRGNKLRSFFKQAFKEIEKQQIKNLVVDMRGNGGGSVTLSNLLTKYIAGKPFVIADSLYAIRRSGQFAWLRNNRFFNWLFLQFLTKKKSDGYYHFGWYEQKKFSPNSKHHFNGTTYILTGGNTFSAATLFTKALIAQDNVVVVGEETGGGAYGNNAWLIPDVTLPNTGVRFRLPLFRLVVDKDAEKGRGVQPEVPALPTLQDLRRNLDFKMEKVRALIKEGQ